MEFANALAHHRAGRIDAAAQGYEAVLQADPGHYDAAYFYSVLLGARGELAKALAFALQAATLRPGAWEAQAQAGSLLLASGRAAEAVPWLRRALALAPDRADVHNNLGAALRALGEHASARAEFETAARLAPAYRDARFNAAVAALAAGDPAAAVVHAQSAVAAGPPTAEACDVLSRSLWKTQCLEEAIAAARRAVDIDPGYVPATANLGVMLLESGDLEGSRAALLRVLELDPQHGLAHRLLANAHPDRLESAGLAALEALSESLPEDAAADLFYALGRRYEPFDKARSFEYYRRANAARRARLPYDEPATLQSMRAIAEVFTEEFLHARGGHGDSSDLPVFVVGMPRSGTTLVEQILASHPSVFGAGELDDLERAVEETFGAGVTSERMRQATDEEFASLGERYVRRLRALAGPGPVRVTDKMPDNVRYAGLIALALPNARIVHVSRDPLETCFSCFTRDFAGENLGWTYDLEELGRYHRAYRALSEHWRATLPEGTMLDVRYEDVVEDVEAQARRIVAFCGLPWDPRCLSFYENERPVLTASNAQVRKPIYRDSLRRAHDYGGALEPLVRAIGTD